MRIWRRAGLFCCVVFCLVLLRPLDPVTAQEKEPAKVAAQSKAGLITMNFKDVDIGVLIRFISEITGKNFLVDPGVKGQVTIISPEKITVDEAYRVFLSVLEVSNFAAVPSGKVIKIIKAAEAKGKGVETRLEPRLLTPDDKIVTQLHPLKYADASDLAKMLKPLVAREGLLVSYPETNTLIIIDVLSNIERLLKIIAELDVPGVEEITVFMLEFARAEKLASKLTEVFQKKKGKAAGMEVFKIIPDERTNSLIVLATPKTMADVRMLIEKLDRQEVKTRANIHIYTLENAVAEDLVKVLSEIPGKGAGTPEQKGKTPLISKEVQISADKATNSVVIIAEPEEYKIIEEVIRKLDVPRRMVYVEALILEVSADKALNLGVEWRVGDEFSGGYGQGSKGGVWLGGSAPASGNLTAFTGGQLPTGLAVGVIGRAITLGGITFPSIGAFVRAVRTDTDINVISTPQLLTLDNQEAMIEVGQNLPFVTRVDQGTAITDRAIQSFEYRDVGVTLKVTPQINQSRFVRLKIEESVKNVVESTALEGTVLAPTTTFRTAKTTITVQDGETAVIGGLIENRMGRARTQTPCIGNIPLLGWAFKQVTDRDVKTNLMVFLTPHIVESPDEGRALYEQKKEYLDEETEKASQISKPEKLREMGLK